MPRLRLIGRLAQQLRPRVPSGVTEIVPIMDRAQVTRILELAMRIADSMLAVGASANDVTLSLERVAAAYGVRPLHVAVTYNAITVSFHPGGDTEPLTIMRVVRPPVPDHAKLQRLQALIVEIEQGLEPDAAAGRYAAIRRMPFRYPAFVVVASQALLCLGVAMFMGGSWVIMIAAFVAAAIAAVVQRSLGRLRVPFFFSQVAGAAAVTGVAIAVSEAAVAGVSWFEGVRAPIVVAAGIILMLSGLSVVGAAQDAIDGFALTALGRGIELMIMTAGVVVGIVAALQIASRFAVGVQFDADALPEGSALQQVAGAVVIAIAVAVANGSGLRTIVMSMLLGAIAWAGWHLTLLANLGAPVAATVGAFAASFVGILVAHRLHVPSIAVTTAAIVPLVPGYTLFRALHAFATADSGDAMLVGVVALTSALSIGLGLASGATLGLVVGAPVRDRMQSAMRGRWRPR